MQFFNIEQAESPTISFTLQQYKSCIVNALITIPRSLVNILFKATASDQQHFIQSSGFSKGEVPIEYIEQNFMHVLIEHTQEFLFKYFALPFLYKEISQRKLLISGDPKLNHILVAYNNDASFSFELHLFDLVCLQEWKYLPFKAPKRKKYKDLDRQVDSFIKEEHGLHKTFGQNESNTVHPNDWILFSIEPLNQEGMPLFAYDALQLWVKMGDEQADESLRSIFLGKTIGECFISNNSCLQQLFSDQFQTNFFFRIYILDILHDYYFCFESFKKYFRIKTNKEAVQKLIEVFSYRNDMSQRRTTVEEALNLLLSKHIFDIPEQTIIRHKELLIERISLNPDYHVYRTQKDFNQRVMQLAEKQVKEMLLLDQLAYQDNVICTDYDIKSYLNLTKRPRTKEFIYFDIPLTKMNGKETPLCSQELKRICMREKTANYIIYHLTRL